MRIIAKVETSSGGNTTGKDTEFVEEAKIAVKGGIKRGGVSQAHILQRWGLTIKPIRQ